MSNSSVHPTEIVLYSYFRSSTSYRVRCALNLKKLNYTYKPVHLLNNGGEQNQIAYREMNPMGGVPTLIHNKNTIAQSYAIIQYLEDVFLETEPLFPEKPIEKALVNQFCQIINADLHSYANLKTLQYLEKKFGIPEAQRTQWIHDWFENGFQALEAFLVQHAGQFCFKDSITAADCFLVPLVFTANRFKMDTSKFTHLSEVFKRLEKVPEINNAHPFRQPDTPPDLVLK